MEKAKLHLIGNAHLDPVWMWRWQEGFAEILATYRSALDRMKEFPEFKFTSACASYYQWVEKMDPDMFEEIRQRVKEGRWNIVGGWFLQPDCNLPCGESFARHGLISQRYFKEKFGVTAKTGYNVDSFGHNASLPQILKKSGMDNYVFMRPMPYEKKLDAEVFQWESADGSRVSTHRIPQMYALGMWETLDVLRNHRDWVDEHDQSRMAFYGVGNHGGGPTIKLIEKINELNLPDTVFSTPDEYFESIDSEQLPVLRDELQHHARGCYSASSYVKANNRKCENNLLTAEKFCSMAEYLAGAKYPEAKLKKAWKNVLFNQFHDIMGGCSVKEAYEDAGYLFGEAMSITEQAINVALQSISRKIDTLQGKKLPVYKNKSTLWKLWEHEVLGTPAVVFNPHTWPVRIPVQLNAKAKKMADDQGNEIPFQLVRGSLTNGADDHYHTVFMAEVGPLGYAVYRVFAEQESQIAFDKELFADGTVLENSRIRVEFSKNTGDIVKLYDKHAGKYIIDGECSAILLDETAADTWAHDKDYLGPMVGTFDMPEFKVLEDGPVRTTLRVVTRCGSSVLQRDYTLVPDCDVVTVKTKVDFHERHRTLKFAFPAAGEEVIAKIPYGTIRRKLGTGEEFCGSWFATGDLCVANDSKYGYDTTDDMVRLTVLRSCVYNDHFGKRDDLCEYMEQGVHEFTYQLFPYRNNCDAERRAAELNAAPRVIMESFHEGSLPERKSTYACEDANVVVTAIKRAEDGDGTIVRFYEIEGEEGSVSIELFDDRIETSVAHHEIKTMRTDGRELDFIEWDVV